MADPRDDLTLADMANDPNILRLTVRPEGVAAPPPTDTGWGGFGALGRPEGRLFEPDQSPAPRPTIGERIGIQPIEGVSWSPVVEGAQALGRGIGSLVQGAGTALSGMSRPPSDLTGGSRLSPGAGTPSAISGLPPRRAPVVQPPGGFFGTTVNKALDEIQQLGEAQQVQFSPGATPEQRTQAREAGPGLAANITMNVAGTGVTAASIRGGASAGVFGGRLSKFHDPEKEKLAQLMEGNGVPPQQIWKDTGMVKFADGKWRHEISDLGASYKGDVNSIAAGIFDRKWPDRAGMYGKYGGGVPTGNVVRSDAAKQEALLKIQRNELVVEDVLPHPLLKEAYGDEVMKIPIKHDPTMPASGGYLARHKDTPQGQIVYREEDKPGKLARGITFDTVIHEVQHAIDNIEGHAKGANMHYFAPGSAPDKIYQKMMAELPPGISKKNVEMFERYARVHAGMEGYQKSPGEAANIANLRKDFSPQQAAAVYPPAQMKFSLKEQKPFVEFNAPFDPAQQQAQMGSILNPAPEMQMSAPRPQITPKFPQYGERYPEVGPPVQATDPKSGKEYTAKKLTPEAEAFAKELRKVDKAMEKEGYTPYFDPSRREHVDPSHYPPNVDTTKIIPKKPTEKDLALIPIVTGEESRARLRGAYQRGTEMPNTKDWYAMKQLEDEFIKELGPEAGRKAFQDKIATSMGATTGGADPTTNWRMAQYGNYLRQNNLPYPTAAHEMPYPIGGRFAGQNIALHKKIFDEGGFPALGKEYPKRHNFSQNFTGNRGAATMDEQMSDLMTPGTLMPPKGRYGYYENVLAEEAAKVGVQPQNYQDVAWSGAKNLKDPRYKSGEPFIQTINESIERTHRLTGMPREEIVRRGLIRSEIPMYGLAGAVGIGSLVDPAGYGR